MGERLQNVTHIKHSANTKIPLKIEETTTILIKSNTPYISALKRIKKTLQRFEQSLLPQNKKYQGGGFKSVKYISVKGLGKAIEKCLSLGLAFQDKIGYKIEVLTGTVEVLDEFKQDGSDSEEESEYRKRRTNSIEIRVYLNRGQ